MSILMIIILGILLFIILYSNLKIELNFTRHGKDDIVVINLIALYGIFKYTKNIPFLDLVKGRDEIPALEIKTESKMGINESHVGDNKSILNMYEIERIIKKYKNFYFKYKTLITHISKRLIISDISWYTELGTNDAAETAIITGFIWSIKSFIIAALAKDYNLINIFINVVPNYNIKIFKTSVDCIFSIKLGNIINAGVKTLLVKIKDGVKNERTSDRSLNEDYNGKY